VAVLPIRAHAEKADGLDLVEIDLVVAELRCGG